MRKDTEMGKSPETPPPPTPLPPTKHSKKKSKAPPATVEGPRSSPPSIPPLPFLPPLKEPPAPAPPSAPPPGPNPKHHRKNSLSPPTSVEILVPPPPLPPPPGHHQKMKLGDGVVEMEDGVTRVEDPNVTPTKIADCYCEPNQWCCFKRCMKLGTMVGFVGFFDAGLYMMLSCVCGFVLLMWESTGKYVKARGFTTKYEWWEKFMIPNEDGIYLLLAAYVVSAIAGWNLGLRFKKMKRCPAVWWLMCNIYTTGLQITSMIFFPFPANMYNLVPIGIRVYEYWVVWSWDMFLKARNEKLDEGEQCPQLAMELKEDTEVKFSKPLHPHHHHHHETKPT